MSTFKLTQGRAAAQATMNRRAAQAAQAIRNEAVINCPVDSGRLRASITSQKMSESWYRVGTNVEYAPYVEFGTRHMAAQPYLRPALEKVKRRA